VHPDGSGRTELVTLANFVTWSPDSQRVAYDSPLGDVHVVNVDGTNDHVVLNGSQNFDWRPATN
jgi:hypothetical protein